MPGAYRRGHPREGQNQGGSLWAAAPGVGPVHFGVQVPTGHVVTCHFTPAIGAGRSDADTLFYSHIPTKIIINLVDNEVNNGAWLKNPFHFAHVFLNSACLVVDGHPLPAQPLQPDFEQGTYTEAYHALMKSSSMYPSDLSNELRHRQFVGSSMPLSQDLTTDDSDSVAYLSCRHLGNVKASLRFAKLLSTSIMLMAYA